MCIAALLVCLTTALPAPEEVKSQAAPVESAPEVAVEAKENDEGLEGSESGYYGGWGRGYGGGWGGYGGGYGGWNRREYLRGVDLEAGGN